MTSFELAFVEAKLAFERAEGLRRGRHYLDTLMRLREKERPKDDRLSARYAAGPVMSPEMAAD